MRKQSKHENNTTRPEQTKQHIMSKRTKHNNATLSSSRTWASTHSSGPSAPSRDSPATWSTAASPWPANPNYWAPARSASADAASARRSSCSDQSRRLAAGTPMSCSHRRHSTLASATVVILLAASSILWPRCCGLAVAFDIDFEAAKDVEGGLASSARSLL